MSMDLFERFASGRLVLEAGECNAADCPWKAHPAFSGGMLKDLLSTEQTGGLYSLHLVRIEPGMSIGLHTHPESVELHAVLDGSGWLRMGGERAAV